MKIKEFGEEREIGECKINVQGKKESKKRKRERKKKEKKEFFFFLKKKTEL